MPTQNVNLPDHQSQFIRERVESGRYQNASEVVRAGLRLLEQREAEDQVRLENLRRISEESFAALDRGEYTSYAGETVEDLIGKIDRDFRARSR
ncbi:MAG: type II toxin-antitoxin system ParD family antitoxin [Phycisphaeraceae bacterium]|nr:type II toxin-antitoxin system ParD family antitoxin [Phycisphaeraceae bacterium]